MYTGHEKRHSFRILETVFLKYEVITEEEFKEGLERRKLRLGNGDGLKSKIIDLDARLIEKLFLLKLESAAAHQCIFLMNEKLNAVLDQLPETRASKAALARGKAQTCELASEGMAFATDEILNPGTYLHLQILLESDSHYFETFCTVLRKIPPPGEDNVDRHGIAVEFAGLKSAEKEILIQHLFTRESETLRMRRKETETESESET